MRFIVCQSIATADIGPGSEPCVILTRLSWDDFDHQTLYTADLERAGHVRERIGMVKIAWVGQGRVELDDAFDALAHGWCSLGQSWDYYRRAEHLGIRDELLASLRDLGTMSNEERVRVRDRAVVAQSLLRFTTARHALARYLGQDTGPYQFTLIHQVEGFSEPHRVDFHFDRDRIGGRTVILVGANGTGKTRYSRGLMRPILGVRPIIPSSGARTLECPDIEPRFSFILTISFSAFDPFLIPRFPVDGSFAKYAGLRHHDSRWSNHSSVSLDAVFKELEIARGMIRDLERTDSWHDTLREHGIRPPEQGLRAWLDTRSAGQKVVFFTLTHLHAYIDEQALIIFDEPESHSHPAMLSLLMRQLRRLLDKFDAFAIVATHSPIVLQETPARQVRVFRREGRLPHITRYPGECFAQDLNEIVRRGFGLDEDDRNYKKLLEELVESLGAEKILDQIERMGLAGRLALEELTGERE